MKLDHARFEFTERSGDSYWVLFEGTEVLVCGAFGIRELLRIDNSGRLVKPCVTHCVDLIRRATGRTPATEFARKRQKSSKPALRIHTEFEVQE